MRTKYNLKPKQISKPDQNVKLKSKEKNLIWIPKSKPIQTKYQTLIIITKYQTIYFFFFFHSPPNSRKKWQNGWFWSFFIVVLSGI